MPASSSSLTAVLVDDSDPELGELAAIPAAPPGTARVTCSDDMQRAGGRVGPPGHRTGSDHHRALGYRMRTCVAQ